MRSVRSFHKNITSVGQVTARAGGIGEYTRHGGPSWLVESSPGISRRLAIFRKSEADPEYKHTLSLHISDFWRNELPEVVGLEVGGAAPRTTKIRAFPAVEDSVLCTDKSFNHD